MSPAVAKIIVRTLGTLAGLFGLLMTLGAIFFLLSGITRQGEAGLRAELLFLLLPLALAVYGLYVGWLVWFRFSPLAVRHVCGMVGFAVFTQLPRLLLLGPGQSISHQPEWMPFAFLGSLLLIHFLYRVASERISRVLFPTALSSEGQT